MKDMVIYLGADHRGFELKNKLRIYATSIGYEVADLGAATLLPDDDYTDYARAVAKKISLDSVNSRGILLCGSGGGMAIAANRFPNVRANLALSPDQVYASRHDDDANILVIAADFTDENAAAGMVKVFLTTPFGTDARYRRRVAKIDEAPNI